MFRVHASDYTSVKHGALHVVKRLRIRYNVQESPIVINNSAPYSIAKTNPNWNWLQDLQHYQIIKKAVLSAIKLDKTIDIKLIDQLNDNITNNQLGVIKIKQIVHRFFTDLPNKYIGNMLSVMGIYIFIKLK